MKELTSALGLLLLFTRPFESDSYRRSLQTAPLTGISFKLPLQSSSFSSSPSPSPTGLAVGTSSSSTVAGNTDAASATASLSSVSEDAHSATNASSSADVESSSASSSSGSTSIVDLIEPISTNESAVVDDPEFTNSSAQTNVSAVQEDLIQALELDEQVTVLGEVQLGELLCESLDLAEGAPLLQFALSANETILANQTSYVEISGEIYTGGIGRKIWAGTVVDPEPAADEAFPRGVSMTWGEVCDVETFSLEITKHLLGGNTSLVKSVPCGLSGVEICLVEVALEFLPGSQPLTVDITGTGSSTNRRRRRLSGEGRRHSQPDATGQDDTIAPPLPPDPLPPGAGLRAIPPAAPGVRHRRLQSSSVEIQAAVFYSDQALDLMGVGAVQMESLISAAFLTVNTGFNNSEIGLEITIVYQGILPYEEGTSDSGTKLSYMRTNSEVNDIRDQHGADLVLLVGELNDVCGLAYFLPDTVAGYSEYAYGSVHPNCFSRLVIAHEFGHNLGCEHNRNHSTTDMEYAHGYRYCSGTMYTTIMSYSEDCTIVHAEFFVRMAQPSPNEPRTCTHTKQRNTIDRPQEVISNFRGEVEDPRGEDDDNDDFRDLWALARDNFVFCIPIGLACYFIKRR
ncbi:unnamed protein product, partial [Scytosiphon promiscuus]